MWHQLLRFLLVPCVLIISPLLASEDATLTVKGIASLSKPADEVQFTLGVITQGTTAESALSDNNTKMNAVIQSLESSGLKKKEYKTGRFSLRPLYSQRPKNAEPNWSPKIVGYEVSNTLSIKTDNLSLIGTLIDTATRLGANTVNAIQFTLKDPLQYRNEAIEQATQRAKADAKTLSEAAGVSLMRIQTLTLDDAQSVGPIPRSPIYAKSLSAESIPIEPGEIEVHASVTLQYEIGQK